MSDGFFILLAMIVAAIIAFLLGRLLSKGGGNLVKEWEGKYDLKARDYSQLELKHKEANTYSSDLEKRNKALGDDREKSQKKYFELEKKLEQSRNALSKSKSELAAQAGLSKDLKQARDRFDDLKVRTNSKDATIKDLMASNDELEKEKAALLDKLNAALEANKVAPKREKPRKEEPRKEESKKEEPKKDDAPKKEVAPKIVQVMDEKVVKEYEGKLKVLRDRNDALELEFNKLNKSVDGVNRQKNQLAQNLEKAQEEIVALKQAAKGNDNQAELEKLNNKLAALQVEYNKSKGSYEGLQLTNGDLIKQVNLLKTQTSGDDYKAKYDALVTEHSDCGDKVTALEKEHAACNEKLATLQKEHESCNTQIAALQKEIEALKTKPAPVVAAAPVSTGDAKKDEVLNRIREKAQKIDFNRIGRADAAHKDNLQDIKGIGPFIEAKLNALGIYTFKQIANFTEEDDDLVNEAIEFFPGRVKRDDWKGQAKGFVSDKES